MKKLECILLIDDDDTVNFYNEFLIGEMNIADKIVIRENGEEALNYLKECADSDQPFPNLILLDINMPIMDGFEFLQEFQKLPSSTNVDMVVVMLTTSLHPEDKDRAETFDCVSGYLYKPLLEKSIREIVQKNFALES